MPRPVPTRRAADLPVPRFDNGRDARRVAKRLSRQKLEVPIAHDPGWTLWQHYGIEAWPTVVLIDGEGNIRERWVGDGQVRELDAAVTSLNDEIEIGRAHV